jgi:hypothetical protein
MKKSKGNKSMAVPMGMSKDWRAQDDARTLAQAQAIKADKARMNACAKMAKTMVEEKAQELKGLKAVARSAPRK